uniref:Uncharacterized protein n=1 Tax=Triticum urartu TaxID=4572 RepID=A0A8R7QL08_TRIUA
MPRVGDPDASSILRITYELGYLASIIAGCWVDGNLFIHGVRYMSTFTDLSGKVLAIGRPLMIANSVMLLLDGINSPYARTLSLTR